MNEVERAAEIIENRLDSIYCNTCNRNDKSDEDYGQCDECKRKSMLWGISKKAARELAELILQEGAEHE